MSMKNEAVIKGSLKVKKGKVFKKKKVEPQEVDISIKKDEVSTVKKTDAELAFEKRQRETAAKRLKERAAISHRERVERFNSQMEKLTEFNEMAKVSWTNFMNDFEVVIK
ncbi:hypothetical protein FO519_008084 [Halicephalobus sp. NKZ332]|nr:hypothetical protein FO519_008084 [Halicephalobus sp. NKZ332]